MTEAIAFTPIVSTLPEEYLGGVDARLPAEQAHGTQAAAPGQPPDSKVGGIGQGDKVEISAQGRALAKSGIQTPKAKDGSELTPEQQIEVHELAETDRKVRVHEQTHVSVGGSLVRGGPNYKYETGPDGKRYAIGGEVDIDTSPVKGDPDATIRKAVRIVAAALAPAEPSGQDRAIASRAQNMAGEAQVEKLLVEQIARKA